MKKIYFLATFLIASSLIGAELHEELASLNNLVEATQLSLDNQKELRILLLDYQKAHDSYMNYPDNNDLLFPLVKTAHKLYQSIKDNHLTQTFSQDFLNDLAVFSQVAQKRGIPKP